MIYSVSGADWFRAKQWVDDLVRQCETKQFRIVRVSTDDENWADAIGQYAKQDSLFSERACIVLTLDPKKKGDSSAEESGEGETEGTKEKKERISALIKAFDGVDCVFVIWNRSRKLAYGTATHKPHAKDFALLKGQALIDWVRDYTQQLGTDVSPTLAQDIALACESDTALIAHELQKYSLCYPGEKIAKQRFEQLSSYAPAMTYFDWMRDIFSGAWKTKAMTVALDEHDAAQRLAGLINALRIILVSRTQPSVEKTGFMKNTNPYWVRSLTQWSRAVPEQKLEQWFETLVRYDLWVRSGRMSEPEALERFVFNA